MRLAFTLALLLLFTAPAALAQDVRIVKDDDWCDERYVDRDYERYCEVREISLPADRDVIRVDGRQNGGISIEGWDRDEILVRARIDGNARTGEAARRLADAVRIETDRVIEADVPDGGRREWVSVSFEVFVPHDSDLSLDAHNGGISIAGVSGKMDFRTLNGGVHLRDVGGDVRGKTTNGGLHIELTGPTWTGERLDVETANGGVKLIVPEGYSAELESGTVNGRIHLDFPILMQGEVGHRLSTTLGNGGPLVRAVTTNGGVRIERG